MSVSTVLRAKTAPHAVPQLMPAGLLVTVPFPDTPTAIGDCVTGAPPNAAVTARGRVIGTTQAPAPLHAPAQVTGWLAGVSVTSTPAPNAATHAGPQSMPGTSEPTEPPAVATASAYTVSGGANVAVTEWGAPIVTVHAPVPEHASPQPPNVHPGVGMA